MGLSKYNLGKLIELVTETNTELKYHAEDVRGMTITKEIIPTKANVKDSDLSKFLIVHPSEFIFNPRTHGKKIGFGFNNSKDSFLISWNNIAFKVSEKGKNTVLPEYLFLHFNRSEWDREACFRSWGSSTEVFSWDALCEMVLDLPSIEIQRKYVDVYNAMLANQQSYERGLDDLKLTCDATLESLKKKYQPKTFGDYIQRTDMRNTAKLYNNVKNVSVYKKFGAVSSKVDKNNLGNYKIVLPREISFVQTTHNEKVFCNAMNNTKEPILVTSVNEVFRCDETKILPEYLCLNFNRTEFDRYARFNSWGSARETFTWVDLLQVKIPIPPIEEQKYIVDIFKVLQERTTISNRLKTQIKDLCPILIKGSIEDAKREKEL